MKDNAPAITFWVASVILVLFDARVLDVVYKLTTSPLLAVGAIFTTALMFFIWKNAFQYTLANSLQTALSSVGMALSLIATAVFGGMDYFVRGGLRIDTGAEEFSAVDLIFWGIPVLSVIHVVMLLWYWYADPVVASERRRKQADDDHAFTEAEMVHADTLLNKQSEIVAKYILMAQTFGKTAALQQLDLLGIDREPFEAIEIPSMTTPKLSMTKTLDSSKPSMTEPKQDGGLYEAILSGVADAQGVSRDQLQDPVTVMAGGNGHGKIVNPTKAG